MARMVEVVCENPACGVRFERAAMEVNRSRKLGRPLFHDRKCAGQFLVNNIPPEKRRNTRHLPKGRVIDEYSPFRAFMRVIRTRCREAGWEIEITLEDLKRQWEMQGGICAQTGLIMHLPPDIGSYDRIPKTPFTASVDRIDRTKGYVTDNIAFVCVSANLAKNNFSDEEISKFWEALRRSG